MAQDHHIAEIKGLSEEMKDQLVGLGIASGHDLLARAKSPTGRAQLARELGIEASEVTDWVNRADLMRLTGVGTEMANLLEEGGVDSCKELRHRNPENLHAKLKEINDEQSITHHAPSLAQVTAWIDEAKTISDHSAIDQAAEAGEVPIRARAAKAAASDDSNEPKQIETTSIEPGSSPTPQAPIGLAAAGAATAEVEEEPKEASQTTEQDAEATPAPMGVRAVRGDASELTEQPEEIAPAPAGDPDPGQTATKRAAKAAGITPAPPPLNFTPAPTEGPGWIRLGGKPDCPSDFPVKGNGSSRRFHSPGQLSYPRTLAEFCFADEQAATNHGFRRA